MTAGGALHGRDRPATETALRAAKALPALGPATALALLAGVVLALALPRLPPWPLAAGACVLLAACWWVLPRRRLAVAFGFGLAWTVLHGALAFGQRLPHALEGQDLEVVARVAGLPARHAGRLRADLELLQVPSAPALEGRRVRVSRYGPGPELAPGSTWRLVLRLRRPRGLVNPGGFDFERHALERRIAATGYIRDAEATQELDPGGGIDLLRARLSGGMATALDGAAPARFLQALAVADTRGLDDRDWDVLRATGTSHLLAISGLHVGLVAGFGALLARGLYRLRPRCGLRLPLPQAAAVMALAGAALYTALAGFGLPTRRALLMIAVALLAVLLRRAAGPWQGLALALAAVLLVDPLAALGAGFWLSFLGVGWLLWCLPRGDGASAVRQLGRAQWAMTLGLLPLTVWFFGQASVAGPLANLIAVPWVSLVVVPLTLLGTALLLPFPALAAWPLQGAALAIDGLWRLLEPLAGLHGALVYLPEPSVPALLLALLAAFWLLMPRGTPGKALALLLFAPLLAPQPRVPPVGELELVVFDVGQGQAMLLRTHRHALLYDTGPAHGDAVDLGDSVVVPALRALGVGSLDTVIVSHGDSDHGGGTAAVLRAYAPARVLSGEPRRLGVGHACVAGQGWRHDEVAFRVLHPAAHFPELGNDASCVLRVEAGAHSLLLSGDISEIIEARLLREQAPALRADVLTVPHHGSRSSSSAAFVAAVAPRLAVLSAAHRSRFGHPAPEVVARYRQQGTALAATASGGALRVRLGADGIAVERWRERQRRFWREE